MSDILYAWIYPPYEMVPVLCGRLTLLRGRVCVFNYEDAWLAHPQRFALSPDLPLQPGEMQPPRGFDIHPIFEDAGPDAWGRNVINKVFNPQRRSPLEYLELAGEDRVGALGFSRSPEAYRQPDEQAFHEADLKLLNEAASALAYNMPIDDEIRRLLRPGSSAGGARPKAIITYQDESWIAKFGLADDPVDMCAVEHATLRLAARCGIRVPESRLLRVGTKSVMLVKRFDRENGGRLHIASLKTLLNAEGVPPSELAYADIADMMRRQCSGFEEAIPEMYRRMIFNVCIENTDDHEKNHAFLFRDGYWQLTPAFDMQPQLTGLNYHQLRVGKLGHSPSIENLLSEHARFMLRRHDAESMIEDVFAGVRGWKEVFAKEGVLAQDIEQCARYILRDSLLYFGNVPTRYVPSDSNGQYQGSFVAVNDAHAYQSLGRSAIVRHDRTLLSEVLLMPETIMQIDYKNGHIARAERLQ